jgi:hypothetical protein
VTRSNHLPMTQQHNITPPDELIGEWIDTDEGGLNVISRIATRAAQWGADQELEACCEWLNGGSKIDYDTAALLRDARRPKPPSLKEQALALLDKAEDPSWDINDFTIVRRALEQLDD